MDTIREFRVASETWPEQDFEIRTVGDGLNFTGYAAVFDSASDDLGGFRETIAPGAFRKTIAERGKRAIKMFLNHDWNVVLASTHGGTLRLAEDARGLVVDADLPDNEWGRPVRDAVTRGDISSMSFGFNVVKDEWNESRDQRRVTEVKLWEVSPVTSWPAYPATSASVRRLAELTGADDDELEAAVRVLFSEDTLDDPQHALLMRAINARYPTPTVRQDVAELYARLMARKPE
jgi:uncharacterized protein